MSLQQLALLRSKLAERREQRQDVLRQLKQLNLLGEEAVAELVDHSSTPTVPPSLIDEVEAHLVDYLGNPCHDLPLSATKLLAELKQSPGLELGHLERLLRRLAAFGLLSLDGSGAVEAVDAEKLDFYKKRRETAKRKAEPETDSEPDDHHHDNDDDDDKSEAETAALDELAATKRAKRREVYRRFVRPVYQRALFNKNANEYVEQLLLRTSALDFEARAGQDELNELLGQQTALERLRADKFRSIRAHIQEYCRYLTKDECNKMSYKLRKRFKCDKVHFNRVIRAHTDPALGDCSFLNTCFHMDTCKYVHYEIDMSQYGGDSTTSVVSEVGQTTTTTTTTTPRRPAEVFQSRALVPRQAEMRQIPPQWVRCDLRTLDMSTLGKFAVVMADPPWDIHMELPYGTMADDEMRRLDIPTLQDSGYIFLWVTARAMELGRECLRIWGYERCDEIIWVKTNQLQRIIRTGRTGHWLNHGKEHCLVGVKGRPDPRLFNRMIDCDVIVAEVRATSHKPDEIYGLIERLSPGTRKVELFGRPHNVQPNWITLGNQLDGVRLIEPDVVRAFKRRYPNGLEQGASSSTGSTDSPPAVDAS